MDSYNSGIVLTVILSRSKEADSPRNSAGAPASVFILGHEAVPLVPVRCSVLSMPARKRTSNYRAGLEQYSFVTQ